MLHRIPASFTDKRTAQTAITEFRKRYRVALRGAVVIGPDSFGAYHLHVPLGGTGFSAAEMASALRGLVDHFERSTGLQSTPSLAEHLPGWREATQRIAERRFLNFNPEA